MKALLSSHWRWMRGKASRYPAHTHRASPPAAARMQAGTQGLGTRSIHTPYNPSTPVIIRTVAENMACHAGTTRTKKLTAMAWATRMNSRLAETRRPSVPLHTRRPCRHASKTRASAATASRTFGNRMNS